MRTKSPVIKGICGWAGVRLTTQQKQAIDGVDFTAPLTRHVDVDQRPLLFHYPHVWGPGGKGYQPHSSVRHGDWKVIYFYEAKTWELYNLAADIGETTDLAKREPDRLKQMKTLLKQQLEDHGAQYPTNINTGQPAKPE